MRFIATRQHHTQNHQITQITVNYARLHFCFHAKNNYSNDSKQHRRTTHQIKRNILLIVEAIVCSAGLSYISHGTSNQGSMSRQRSMRPKGAERTKGTNPQYTPWI